MYKFKAATGSIRSESMYTYHSFHHSVILTCSISILPFIEVFPLCVLSRNNYHKNILQAVFFLFICEMFTIFLNIPVESCGHPMKFLLSDL